MPMYQNYTFCHLANFMDSADGGVKRRRWLWLNRLVHQFVNYVKGELSLLNLKTNFITRY